MYIYINIYINIYTYIYIYINIYINKYIYIYICVFRYPMIVMWGWSNMGNSSKPALAKALETHPQNFPNR